MIEPGPPSFSLVGEPGRDLLFPSDPLFPLLEPDPAFPDALIEAVRSCFDDPLEDIFRAARLGVLLDLFGGGICLLSTGLPPTAFGNGRILLPELLLPGVGAPLWGR